MGRHLLHSLCHNNIHSIVLDNLSNSTVPDFLLKIGMVSDDCIKSSAICFYRVDIRDKDKVRRILSKYDKIDVCIHLAAKISVIDSIKYPEETFDVNVNGTETILDLCMKFGIKHFVFASSSAVYGNVPRLPLSEAGSVHPISPYGESKLKAEQLVSKYTKEIPDALSMRFFNIYGDGQSPEYAGVITKFAQRIEYGLPPIIYGDGQQMRDFITVQDVVRAIMLAATRGDCPHTKNDDKVQPMSPLQSNVLNIGTGVATRILDLAKLMIRASCLKKPAHHSSDFLKPIHVPAVEGDIYQSYADTTKAEQYLKFIYSDDLFTGLKRLFRRSYL